MQDMIALMSVVGAVVAVAETEEDMETGIGDGKIYDSGCLQIIFIIPLFRSRSRSRGRRDRSRSGDRRRDRSDDRGRRDRSDDRGRRDRSGSRDNR